jgi:2,3-dihydro-2,3-dihydroxybenzoate dehydrogenase
MGDARAGTADGSAVGVAAGTTVVVGAAQGIGEAIARRLAGEAWTRRLVVADIRVDLVESLAADLRRTGRTVDAFGVDVTDGASVDALVAASSEAERVAIVSGIFQAAPSLETTRADFQRILGVNLVGDFFVAQAYARCMVTRGSGSIVGIASIASRIPRMRQAAYSASKAGLRQALRVLAMETVPMGVRINTVSPGPTDTPMMRDLAADHASVDDLAVGSPEAFRPRVPDGRVARPEQVAAATAWLLGPDSDHVAFHDLFVDGGESLGA